MQSPLVRMRTSFLNVLKLDPEDRLLIDYTLSLVVANYIKDTVDLVWGWIEGPSGSGKTEVIRTLKAWPLCVFKSELTPQSLASGTNTDDGEDPSLLRDLDGKILVFKDFTTQSGERDDKVAKIMSTLRGAWDGFYNKHSGSQGGREYTAKFGVISCITGVIDAFADENQQLGERLLIFRVGKKYKNHSESADKLLGILDSLGNKKQWRQELTDITTNILNETVDYARTHTLDAVTCDRKRKRIIAVLADLVGKFRTSPYKKSTADPEIASRLAIQIYTLTVARAMADAREEINDEDLIMIRRVAKNTLPKAIFLQLKYAYKRTTPLTSQDVTRATKTSIGLVERTLNQWVATGLMVHPLDNPTLYELSEDTRTHLEFCGLLR